MAFIRCIRVSRLCLGVPLLLSLSGCSAVGYYLQAIDGHAQLMYRTRSIEQLLADSAQAAEFKRRLSTVLEIRDFATRELGLPDNDSYRAYTQLDRPAVVWSVVATGEFSVRPRQWCYPIVGCAAYRGYFALSDAQALAAELKEKGRDVTVTPAAAYSTLGWFDDPLPSTVAQWPEARLAGLIFHELAHQQLYLPGDSDFNESFANTVELAGVRRWLSWKGDPRALQDWEREQAREQAFVDLLLDTRRRLEALYAESLQPQPMREAKQAVFDWLKTEYRSLKAGWSGGRDFDQWFERPLNNARVALIGTYERWVPAFSDLLCRSGKDLPAFYAAARGLSALPEAERQSQLHVLLSSYETRRSCERR